MTNYKQIFYIRLQKTNISRIFYLMIIITCISITGIKAQSDSALKSADKISYDLFNKAEWNSLISFSENALKKNIDFIFLRVRLGIAYYETGKYFDAVKNLQEAFDKGYETPLLIEYLYFSYLEAGRKEDADYYFYKLPENKRKRLKPQDNSFMYEIHVDAGYGLSNDENKNENIDLDGSFNAYGEQTLFGNYFYLNAGFKQLPLRWLNVIYSYNYLSLKKTKQIMYNNVKTSDPYTQQQQQFYIKYDIRAGDGFVISPSGHYIYTSDNTIYSKFDSVNYSYNMQTMTYDSLNYFYTINNKPAIQDNFVLSLSLSKQIYIYKAALHGSFSYLNGNHQSQIGANFKAFPKKKNTLYTFTDLTLQNQNDVTNLIVYQSLGGKLHKNLWGEAFVTIGKMNNYNEQNGAVVYNNPDVINLKFGGEMKYYFNENLSASLIYVNEQREKNYLTYTLTKNGNNSPIANPEYLSLDYSVNTILAGLKLYF